MQTEKASVKIRLNQDVQHENSPKIWYFYAKNVI